MGKGSKGEHRAWHVGLAQDPVAGADAIEREVSQRIAPDAALVARLAATRARLVERSEAEARRLKIPLARTVIAGSAARGTFLNDRLDIDCFLLFPPNTPREQLEKDGLALGRALLEAPELRYAEHPYLRGTFDGFTVETVPGFAAISWFALFGPAGMPPDVTKKLNAEVRKIFADPNVQKNFLDVQYFESIAGSPEDLTKRIATEEPRWRKLLQDAHIKLE